MDLFVIFFSKAIDCITGTDALLVYVFLHTDPKILLMKGLSCISFSLVFSIPEVKNSVLFYRANAILYEIKSLWDNYSNWFEGRSQSLST